ncbi:cupin domain-containing protein [Daedalea quercina L-15889]|uniref:Cupin domain-containing protein n=1 Tax=Daedalea quercina L-15889 TaxID=1314783 RepID=A0A165QNE8_9APHY|nr:cupin domain-containing protein [Daedalea quercina L-15889]
MGPVKLTLKITPLSVLRTSTHHIPAHGHIPNTSLAPHPLLIYHSAFAREPLPNPSTIEGHLRRIGAVHPQWRHTMYNQSHFHSTSHELLVVFRGAARLLFGGDGNPGAVTAEARMGDAMLVPAGVAHRLLEDLQEGSAFEMIGSYPVGKNWDMCHGDGRAAEDVQGIRERIRGQGWFDKDPIYGDEGPALRI